MYGNIIAIICTNNANREGSDYIYNKCHTSRSSNKISIYLKYKSDLKYKSEQLKKKYPFSSTLSELSNITKNKM